MIVRSFIHLPQFDEVLFDELIQSQYVTLQEKEILKYIQDVFSKTGYMPTEQILESNFPALSQGTSLQDFVVLDQDSLAVEVGLFFEERKKEYLAKEVVSLSLLISNDGITNDVHDRLYAILSSISSNVNSSYEDPFDYFVDYYQNQKSKPKGLKFYIQSVDEVVGGLNAGTLNTIMGYTGSFKSTLALNLIYNNIVKENYKICLITLEVPKNQVVTNLLSRHSYDSKFDKYPYIPHKKIRETSLDPDMESYLFQEVYSDFQQYKNNLVIFDQTDFNQITPLEIEKALDRADRLLDGLDAFIIDHIGLLKFSSDSRRDEKEIMNEYMRFFQGQCVNFLHKGRSVTGIVLAQANRDGYLRAIRNNGDYDLRAISDANEIERSSYRVFSVYQDPDLLLSKEIKIGLIKHRDGPLIIPSVSVFCEPEAYVIGDVDGFNTMPSMEEFSDFLSFGDFNF